MFKIDFTKKHWLCELVEDHRFFEDTINLPRLRKKANRQFRKERGCDDFLDIVRLFPDGNVYVGTFKYFGMLPWYRMECPEGSLEKDILEEIREQV